METTDDISYTTCFYRKKIKNLIFTFFLLIVTMVLFCTCEEEEEKTFDVSLIPGKYLCGTINVLVDIPNSPGSKAIYHPLKYDSIFLNIEQTEESSYTINFDSFRMDSDPDSIIAIPPLVIELAGFDRDEHAFFIVNPNGYFGSKIEGGSYGLFYTGNNYYNFFHKLWTFPISIQLDLKSTEPDNIYFLDISARHIE